MKIAVINNSQLENEIYIKMVQENNSREIDVFNVISIDDLIERAKDEKIDLVLTNVVKASDIERIKSILPLCLIVGIVQEQAKKDKLNFINAGAMDLIEINKERDYINLIYKIITVCLLRVKNIRG